MLDICVGNNNVAVQIPPSEEKILCDLCDQEAFIFQEEGNFCLQCWQKRTEPCV